MNKKIGFMTTKESALKIAEAMYTGEPCRICGETITDISGAVYAGYSKDNKSRSAHKSCWESNKDQATWAYPS